MSTDDGDDDDSVDRVPPPPPDDRLWRHPSEVSAFGSGRVPVPVAPIPASTGRAPVWPVALVGGVVGAVLCGGVLALTGNLAVDAERVIERVQVTPFLPSSALTDERSVDALKDRVSPSVVRLRVTTGDGEVRAGGVIVRDDGIVVTSAHEVTGATAITVVLADGRDTQGELVGADLPSDVGVVRIDATGLTAAVLGNAEDLEAGDVTVAIGMSNDGDAAVSSGVVSALGQRLDADGESLHGLIKTDAPIEGTWAGGPLVDDTGAVIGITTDLAGDHTRFGYAMPIELVHSLAGEMLAYGKVTYGWLGIEGADVADDEEGSVGVTGGAEVRRVMPGSPADRSGLASGDVITEVGGERVRSTSDLVVALRAHKPGEVVVVRYWRDGRRFEVEATIAPVP